MLVEISARPPGLSTRRTSRRNASERRTCSITWLAWTVSNSSSANGRPSSMLAHATSMPARAGVLDVLRDEVDPRHPRRADALGDPLGELALVGPDVEQGATAPGRQHAQHGAPVLFLGGVEEPFEAALRRRSVAHSAATAFLNAAYAGLALPFLFSRPVCRPQKSLPPL